MEGTGAVGPWRFLGGCARVKVEESGCIPESSCLPGSWAGNGAVGGWQAVRGAVAQASWVLEPAGVEQWVPSSHVARRQLWVLTPTSGRQLLAPSWLPGAISHPGPWLTSEQGITRMFRGESGIGGTQGFARLSQIKFRRCSERGARVRGDSGASESSPPACFAPSSLARSV